MSKIKKWDDERTAKLTELAGEDFITQARVTELAEALETTKRSISSKLRKMGFDVELVSAVAKSKTFSEAEAETLQILVEDNSGDMTYADIADALDGDFSAKQVQGKILSMELTSHVKPTPKVAAVKSYTDAEEETFISMANEGAFLEEIAEALDKQLNSVRGKALSLMRAGSIESIPKQRDVKGKQDVDPLATIVDIAKYTVEQLAAELGKTERGVKTMLTRRGITVTNYDGAAKKAKAVAAAE